ncbi:hypothetical protein RBSWK_00644 [Rhodopirellula baltica SWK14]|uniref:Uncharacterized protein n=1 Tax=Rhodopirellula baltica SWK14 TaxID=993516 RepID=L7CNE2_RHOBT|nr:hypothetical protein RBSWK_00644 [Rhodopirellula baltica SWK14]
MVWFRWWTWKPIQGPDHKDFRSLRYCQQWIAPPAAAIAVQVKKDVAFVYGCFEPFG